MINNKSTQLNECDIGKMLTVKDVQEHLKLSKNIVYQLVRMDSFPKIKIGNSYRIPEDKYKKWIDQNLRREIII